jgi:hypothetical protein
MKPSQATVGPGTTDHGARRLNRSQCQRRQPTDWGAPATACKVGNAAVQQGGPKPSTYERQATTGPAATPRDGSCQAGASAPGDRPAPIIRLVVVAWAGRWAYCHRPYHRSGVDASSISRVGRAWETS